jgi:transposase-like protein
LGPGQNFDEKVKAFLSRPIEGDWPYRRIDATYVKVRQNGRNKQADMRRSFPRS